MTSFRKEINLKLQESREEQARQMAALLQMTQALVSSVTGVQQEPASEPGRSSPEVPTSPPGVTFSSLSRPAPPVTTMANSTASQVVLTSTYSWKQTTGSNQYSTSPRATTEFSLPSFQIPKVSEKDTSSEEESIQDSIQIHVEVDELQDEGTEEVQKHKNPRKGREAMTVTKSSVSRRSNTRP